MTFIEEFEKHYDYDCNYMRLLESSAPRAFQTFVDFLPMGQVGKSLQPDTLWTAKIASMLTEDCGACVQLSIKMALEAGVKKELIKNIIKKPETLPKDLMLIYNYSQSVALNKQDHHELYLKVKSKLSDEQMAELSLAIASTKVYPTIKRALGKFESCMIYDFSY